MKAVVFVGPTLRADTVRELLDATILPPVQQGDVYRAVRDKPPAIGIIDGYFDGVPSVWHKEILWAIEQGIPVFGSASMGALRAAELADFGMIGIGQVFEDYLSGALEDDDEVAVLHGPAELGFPPLSEPMVSIRATIAQARTEGVLQSAAGSALLRTAKELHYRDRVWDRIMEGATPPSGLEGFQRWLPEGRVDTKGDDARTMLTEMARCLDEGAAAPDPQRVERTLAWRELCTRVDTETTQQETGARALVDELRLDPVRYAELRDRAALSLLSQDAARRQGREPDKQALLQQMTEHRLGARLPRHADLIQWLQENDLTLAQYETMLADRSRVDIAIEGLADELDAALLTELRRAGDYSALRERARRKAEQMPRPNSANGAANRTQSLIWYFETRLDQAVPDDLESHAIALGLEGRDAFVDLIEAEFVFCQLDRNPADQGSDVTAGIQPDG
ncbi:ankyrin [Ruegeria sp. ANG-R]|uniref:TfuA-like protein n=1 Tax=Ruegeria sp. ANG-R TaxID=1577903 RepID=UPI00058067E8|nr:TfuA-like protein [Ruegeria sp. ANG-R]KIC38515.1 ankyrin [Ruegeria sp. ANG-R]